MKALPQQMRGYASPDELAIRPSAARPALDVDVIDTTWMQAGLPAGDPDLAINTLMRHSYFTINQLVVDDLVEVMTTGRRAQQRMGRLRRRDTGDVFRFFSSGD